MATQPLCEYCSRIPIKSPLERSGYSLGHGERVKRSNCPLCQLVVRALQKASQIKRADRHLQLSDMDNVVLYWRRSEELGSRRAFTTSSAGNIWLCIAASASDTDSMIRGHILNQTVEAEFNVDRLSAWISNCSHTHGGHCSSGNSYYNHSIPGLDVLRFIDVERLSIVEFHTAPRYVALSYVWGEIPTVKLTTGNRPSLLLPGGLGRAWSRLPHTIADAIELVRRLDAQYLWVDTLCLVQNDPRDLECGINVMDEIYERSWLTIIAADGHDANAGLPGIYGETRFGRIATKVTEDISMGVFVPLHSILETSVYTSRAWTFQEQLLARRAVYFADNQVFFRCREDMFAESLIDHPLKKRVPRLEGLTFSLTRPFPFLGLTANAITPLGEFARVLKLYTRRALTNQSDILHALAGVIRRLSGVAKCTFLEGLPTAAFDAFLVFKANGWMLRRRTGFPSYSWTGWRGGIAVERSEVLDMGLDWWLEKHTWIIWYKRSPSGAVSLVWDASEELPHPAGDVIFQGYQMRRPFESHLVSTRGFQTIPTESIPLELPANGYHLLQFWTLSVHFSLQDDDRYGGTASVRDKTGAEAGKVFLDGVDESAFFDSQDSFEFILLSSYDTYDERYFYFIMLLEWNGPIAERRGLGHVNRDAIVNSFPPGPQWKEIVLG